MCSSLAFLFLLLSFFSSRIAQAVEMPICLAECFDNHTHPCIPDALPVILNCVDTICYPRAARMSITYMPMFHEFRKESSRTSLDEFAPALDLNGTGACVDSPYDFRSLFVSSHLQDMNALAERCNFILYDYGDCAGRATIVDVSPLHSGTCQFSGDTSARLDCGGRIKHSVAYRALVEIYHAQAVSNHQSTRSSSKAPSGTEDDADESPSPKGAGGHTFTDEAIKERVVKPSMAALVPLIAAALIML